MGFMGIGIHWWGGAFGFAILLRLWLQLLRWSKWKTDIHAWIKKYCHAPAPSSGEPVAYSATQEWPEMPEAPGWP